MPIRKIPEIDQSSLIYRNGKVDWSQSLPMRPEETKEEWRARKRAVSSALSYQKASKIDSVRERRYAVERVWKDKNKEYLVERAKRKYDNERHKILWHSARTRAKKKGLPFSLTLEWIEEKIRIGVCDITGEKISISSSRRKIDSPSIERKDNKLGYSDDNCILVWFGVNIARNTFPIEDFINMCKCVSRNEEKIMQMYCSNHKPENRKLENGKAF